MKIPSTPYCNDSGNDEKMATTRPSVNKIFTTLGNLTMEIPYMAYRNHRNDLATETIPSSDIGNHYNDAL